jgi:hypothetical protein
VRSASPRLASSAISVALSRYPAASSSAHLNRSATTPLASTPIRPGSCSSAAMPSAVCLASSVPRSRRWTIAWYCACRMAVHELTCWKPRLAQAARMSVMCCSIVAVSSGAAWSIGLDASAGRPSSLAHQEMRSAMRAWSNLSPGIPAHAAESRRLAAPTTATSSLARMSRTMSISCGRPAWSGVPASPAASSMLSSRATTRRAARSRSSSSSRLWSPTRSRVWHHTPSERVMKSTVSASPARGRRPSPASRDCSSAALALSIRVQASSRIAGSSRRPGPIASRRPLGKSMRKLRRVRASQIARTSP